MGKNYQSELNSLPSFQSAILQPNQLETLNDWVGFQQLHLVYRGSSNGFQSTDFHQFCDGKQNLLIVIQSTNNCIFGGYTANLCFTSQNQYISGKNTWLFSLTTPSGERHRRYFLRHGATHNALYDYRDKGPCFGYGNDIHISCDCKNVDSYTNFPHSYEDPLGQREKTFTGHIKFRVNEIEVFQCICK
jgi:hypothetical protein